MFEALLKHCFGTVFLVWDCFVVQGDYLSNWVCAALRAMTDPKGESAVMLFMIFIQLLEVCGVIHNFDHPSDFVCGASNICSFNNLLIAPLVTVLIICPIIILLLRSYLKVQTIYFEFQGLIFLESVHNHSIVTFLLGKPNNNPG